MKRAEKRDGWFRTRGYSHLDWPISFAQAEAIAIDPARVAVRSFLPLIGYTDKKRQFRTDNSDKTIPRRLRPRLVKTKERDIKYASHADAAILSFYAMRLQAKYETWLRANSLCECVIGYRSGIGSNVDMAAAAFADVSGRGDVTALCFDIANFFPSISHEALKAGLLEVLRVETLPDDWYRIFRETIKFCWFDLGQASQILSFDPEDPPSPIVSDIRQAMTALRRAKLLFVNQGHNGIPQGTPISAVFANVSMCAFDRCVGEWAKVQGAAYRRYSDDILLLVPPDQEQAAVSVVNEAAEYAAKGLEINPDKTETSRFITRSGVSTADRPLTYLGFTFNGREVYLKDRALSRYYRRMTYAARGTVRGAGKAGYTATKAFRRSVYRDLTHLGTNNFYTYASRSHGKFPNSRIKRQLRRHFAILLRKLENRGR